MIRITGATRVPDFAKGQVRDLRVRWACREAGLPYAMRLLTRDERTGAEHRQDQPFGQVPTFEDDGITLCETGAILLHIAERSPTLMPQDVAGRTETIQWMFAAVASVEPAMMNLAEVEVFLPEEQRPARRPAVMAALDRRLSALETVLAGRDHIAAGRFTAADILLTCVLRIAEYSGATDAYPAITAYRTRHEARPAFQESLAEQLAELRAADATGMSY